jgi:hypothetical protein
MMSGNTKLIGFGSGGIVELQRWGAKVQVKLEHEAVKALRAACYEQLPKQPPQRMGDIHAEDFSSFYDETTGRVQASMAPGIADVLAKLLRAGAVNSEKYNADIAEECANQLDARCREHLDYLDLNEPGVT